MTSAVLTLEELAQYLRLPLEIIQDQAEQGKFPGRKIADDWRFLKDAIDDWLRNQDDNRPIFPLRSNQHSHDSHGSNHDHHHHPEPAANSWGKLGGNVEDTAEFAEIEAELRAEIDFND
jgi:excisionase family DNA binding protein